MTAVTSSATKVPQVSIGPGGQLPFVGLGESVTGHKLFLVRHQHILCRPDRAKSSLTICLDSVVFPTNLSLEPPASNRTLVGV